MVGQRMRIAVIIVGPPLIAPHDGIEPHIVEIEQPRLMARLAEPDEQVLQRLNKEPLLVEYGKSFFPVLANMTAGLKAADRNLIDLFRLYGASRWQIVTGVRLPSALPYLLSAMKVSAGLALIGTVVAEFVAGSGTSTGLAWRIIEAGNRLEIARMFAALVLLSGLGIALFWALSALEHLLLRHWHDSRDGASESSQTG